MSIGDEPSTHIITWLPDRITCASYRGTEPDPEKLIMQWVFDGSNPPRVKKNAEGQTTDPVLIPRPGPRTRAQINLWLFNAQDEAGDPPTDGKPVEVVVSGFRYSPAYGNRVAGPTRQVPD